MMVDVVIPDFSWHCWPRGKTYGNDGQDCRDDRLKSEVHHEHLAQVHPGTPKNGDMIGFNIIVSSVFQKKDKLPQSMQLLLPEM